MNNLEDFENDLWKLIRDFPHPKLIIGEYEIHIEGDDDYDEDFVVYKDGKFIGYFEIPQNIIDFLGEEGISCVEMNYKILEED